MKMMFGFLVAIEIFDFISGIAKAGIKEEIKSRKLKNGAIRKALEIGFALLIIIGSKYVPAEYLGIADVGVTAYVGKMIFGEVISITENMQEFQDAPSPRKKKKGGADNEN